MNFIYDIIWRTDHKTASSLGHLLASRTWWQRLRWWCDIWRLNTHMITLRAEGHDPLV